MKARLTPVIAAYIAAAKGGGGGGGAAPCKKMGDLSEQSS